MQIRHYTENNALIIEISGKLNTTHAVEFGETLQNLLERKPQACLLDMTGVDFLSSSGLRVLLAGAKLSRQKKIYFMIYGMREMVKDVFILSGFSHFIKHFSSKDEALDQLLSLPAI